MSIDTDAIGEVLYPYIHSKKKRLGFLPKLKTKLMKIYPQVDGDRVLEIRIHESKLQKARQALANIVTQATDGK